MQEKERVTVDLERKGEIMPNTYVILGFYIVGERDRASLRGDRSMVRGSPEGQDFVHKRVAF